MSASGFPSTRGHSWLQRPMHYERVALRSSKIKIRIELALMALTLAVLALTIV